MFGSEWLNTRTQEVLVVTRYGDDLVHLITRTTGDMGYPGSQERPSFDLFVKIGVYKLIGTHLSRPSNGQSGDA